MARSQTAAAPRWSPCSGETIYGFAEEWGGEWWPWPGLLGSGEGELELVLHVGKELADGEVGLRCSWGSEGGV